MKSPYDILGVSKDASNDQIKKAYRKLAKELHPDLHPNDSQVAEKFKEASAAYSLLSNAETRAKYDRGEIGADGGPQGAAGFQEAYRQYQRASAGAHQGGGAGGFNFNAEDFFADIFGGGGRRRRGPSNQRGADRIYQVTIGFLDAVKGTKKRITLENGKTLDVKIPVNVREGQQIRLKGQGGKGAAGGPNGDALIEVNITPHAFFRLEGNDIYLDLPITLPEAVLGAKIQAPTVDGPVTLNIPAGSNSGKKLRLKGKGAGSAKSSTRGNQYVTLMIMLPENIDNDLRKAVENWSKSHSYRVREKLE